MCVVASTFICVGSLELGSGLEGKPLLFWTYKKSSSSYSFLCFKTQRNYFKVFFLNKKEKRKKDRGIYKVFQPSISPSLKSQVTTTKFESCTALSDIYLFFIFLFFYAQLSRMCTECTVTSRSLKMIYRLF